MRDPVVYMQHLCPVTETQSMYGCKVAGDCVCHQDDDLADLLERQQIARCRPGQRAPWEPTVASIEDLG